MLASVEEELERMNVRNRMRLCLCERVLKLQGTKQVEEFLKSRNGRAEESAVFAKAQIGRASCRERVSSPV